MWFIDKIEEVIFFEIDDRASRAGKNNNIYLDMIVSVSFEGICIIGVDRLPVITAF